MSAPTASLADKLSDAEADNVLLIDGYERIVTADLRMLVAYRDLLTDGLHALRNGSPNVTDEYIERTLSAMTTRIDAIRAR